MSNEKIKEYSNGEITIVWKPQRCIHSAKCVEALPKVYRPKEHPWIQIENASTKALKEQIATCPSGALSYYINGEETRADADQPLPEAAQQDKMTKIEVMSGGPLMVYGNLTIKNVQGEEEHKEGSVALCRCGASHKKPYCDGSHTKVDFDG